MHGTAASSVFATPSTAPRPIAWLDAIPHGAIAVLARIGIGMTFWQSGQTKVENFVLDPIGGHATLGWPRLAPGTVDLFRYEYALPLLPPESAAWMAAVAEHVFPFLLLVGLATRLSALALLAMTLVIQVFVYPAAYATHALWAACLLLLAARGAGSFSLDHWLVSRRRR
jgi:putative oxidoreductase